METLKIKPPGLTKRKRDPAFTYGDKRNLIDLVQKYFNIIECKKTDAISSKAKQNQWNIISTEFNAYTEHIQRDSHSLKMLWENLKKKAKSKMTVLNGNRYATGGGPSVDPVDDPNIDKVISLIKTNVEGLFNPYDSDIPVPSFPLDSSSQEPGFQSQEETEYFPDHSYSQSLQTQNLINGDWNNYSTTLLRTPRAKVLLEGRVLHDGSVIQEEIVETEKNQLNDEEPKSTLLPTTPTSEIASKKLKTENKTPPSSSTTKSSRHISSRRRPVLKESEAVALATTKINTLKASVEHSNQQHEVAMRCLLLQEEQEKEKLKQEKEKTEQEVIKKKILLQEFEKLTNQSTF